MLMLCACSDKSGTEKESDATEDRKVSVVRISSNLKKGDTVSAKDAVIVEVSESELKSEYKNYVSKRTDAIGRKTAEDISEGTYLLESMLVEQKNSYGISQEKLNAIKEEIRNKLKNELKTELEKSLRDEIANGGINAEDLGYIVVTDYIKANTNEDVSVGIQKLIDENPGRTLYFPDGVYVLENPISTSADPEKCVSFQLSNYAVLKAGQEWAHNEAMVRLGIPDGNERTFAEEKLFSFNGGIVDGNMVANGIAIEGGHGTTIRNVSIKHTVVGIHIKNTSDSNDVDLVHVVGNNKTNSIGVLVEGANNTITDMRIAAIQTGVMIRSGGNFLRNLHPLFIYGGEYGGVNDINYADSVAFWDQSDGANFYDFCYSDQLAIGFRFGGSARPILQSCFVMWYSNRGDMEVGFRFDGKLEAIILNAKVSFLDDLSDEATVAFVTVAEDGGKGFIENPSFATWLNKDNSYKKYLVGRVIT